MGSASAQKQMDTRKKFFPARASRADRGASPRRPQDRVRQRNFRSAPCGPRALSAGGARRRRHLVVGVNSDASTRKLKGEGRPILTERARATLVAALGGSGLRGDFRRARCESLLRELQPDVTPKAPITRRDSAGARPRGAARHSRRHRGRSQRPLDARPAGRFVSPPADDQRAMADPRFLLVRLGSHGRRDSRAARRIRASRHVSRCAHRLARRSEVGAAARRESRISAK